jgi:hypothetical protein
VISSVTEQRIGVGTTGRPVGRVRLRIRAAMRCELKGCKWSRGWSGVYVVACDREDRHP